MAVTANNIQFGFARLALVAAWTVAILWLVLLAFVALQKEKDWWLFQFLAIPFVPGCMAVSWVVKIVGWIIAGFFTPGPELDIQLQAYRDYERCKAGLFNFWLITCWLLMWVSADLIGNLAFRYDMSIVLGRVTGFLGMMIILIPVTFVLAFIADEILTRLRLHKIRIMSS
jgi:hypothetical protein